MRNDRRARDASVRLRNPWNGRCSHPPTASSSCIEASLVGSLSRTPARSSVCATLLAISADLHAHGAPYRGPGDVVPPSPGGGRGTGGPSGPSTGGPSGPATPGPGGPATPGPSGPTTGGPAGPSGGRAPTTGGHGIQLDPDLALWQFWWELNKDPFIRLKDAIGNGGAT